MASKNKVSRLESEIEKCRTSSNWAKLHNLVQQFRSKGTLIESQAIFILCECELERYLLDHPVNDNNTLKARKDLTSIEKKLNDLLNNFSIKAELQEEVRLLRGKIAYACGHYQTACTFYDGLDNINLKAASPRKLQLVGEAYAIQGLCLEKMPLQSGGAAGEEQRRLAERDEAIIRCWERSGDISLALMQDHQLVQSTENMKGGQWSTGETEETVMGPFVETAIQRSPILYIRNGELSKGITRFRDLLRAVDTKAFQGLKQTLARQLAEVLLRGVCRASYEPVTQPSRTGSVDGPRPLRYQGDKLFQPQDQCEETLLLLLISESIACREALLNRSEDMQEDRSHTFHSATAVFDLLTIALVRYGQYTMLSETFDRALKFSFDEFHVWYQFALSLMESEKYTRAYLVLKECLRLEPRNAVVLLQAAKLCYEHLSMAEEGLQHCERALELEENPAVGRSWLYVGVGHALLEAEARLKQERSEHQRKAIHAFTKAVTLDSHDYLAHFLLAHQLASVRQIPDALTHARLAVQLNGEHAHSAHLLVLLLSAQQEHEAALRLAESLLSEFPDNFSLLMTKSRLEERVHGPEVALQTCKQLLLLWKSVFEDSIDSEWRGTGLFNKVTSDGRSLAHLHLDYSDHDSGSLRAESLAASRIEQTLSEVASSLGSQLQPRSGPHLAWSTQTQIWLHLGEMYLRMGNKNAAQACINEASAINPLSHNVSYMRGRWYEERGELAQAQQCYENAIAINPTHGRSLQHLGGVLLRQGKLRMAEKVLREGVNSDSACGGMWAGLGRVLHELGESDTASDCLMTAVMLDNTAPIVPFAVIPRALH